MRNIVDFMANACGFIVIIISILGAIFAPYFLAIGYEDTFLYLTTCILGILYFGSIVVIYARITYFHRNTDSVKKLIFLYFESILLFAAIYLWIYMLGDENHISGLANDQWYTVSRAEMFDYRNYFIQVMHLTLNSIHFSIVSGTTLGYGDILPKSLLSKLIVDVQVLYSIGIVVIGYGKFSQNNQGSNGNTMTSNLD